MNTITDVKELESLAYKQILARDQAIANIQALQARIAQLAEAEPDTEPKED